jgi:hypothetical protein
MAIPNAREAPPPPLPPPRHIGEYDQDLGWQYGNINRNGNAQYGSVKPGSSLLGGGEPHQEYAGFKGDHFDVRDSRDSRRGSNMSPALPIDPAMIGAESLDHSDDDRNTRTRPTLSGFRCVLSLFSVIVLVDALLRTF